MQKKPYLNYPSEYSPFNLSIDLPFSHLGENYYTLVEKEITSLHIHDCFEIGYCHNGDGIFIVDDKVMPFSQGDGCIILKNQFHKAQSSNNSQWDFVYINLEDLLVDIIPSNLTELHAILRGDCNFINILNIQDNADILKIIIDIISECRNRNFAYEFVVKGLVLALIYKLSRIIEINPTEDFNNDSSNNILRIIPAIEYISQNYMCDIYIETLATQCNMSLTNFRRYFLNVFKISPLDYINKVRINNSAVLLSSTNLSILEISIKVGYNSLSSFNRHFKRIQGISPIHWRNKMS